MVETYRAGDDVTVLASPLTVPGVGTIPVHAFVLHAEQPVLVDAGMACDADEFVAALADVVDLADLRWVWLTHDDSDHTGALEQVLQLAPRARLAAHAFGALRSNTVWPVPLDRVHALRPGDRLDLGDRTVLALRPPTYDSPMTTGLIDEHAGTLFCVDSFGAILPDMATSLDDVGAEDLQVGMATWVAYDSPWLALTDPARLGAVLDAVRALDPQLVLSSHLPPATGRLDAFLDVVVAARTGDPFVPPDPEAFEGIAALMAAGATA